MPDVIDLDRYRRLLLVAADHPSLEGAILDFAARLRAERRWFGPGAAANPKPSASLVDRLGRTGDGPGAAAVLDGVVVAVCRIDRAGIVSIAVDPAHRGLGIGAGLLRRTIDRAQRDGIDRLVLRTSRRSRAAHRLAAQLGFERRDGERGAVEFVLDRRDVARSA
jgi:GNAT superfamily N-acetyltransferase